MSTPQQFDIQIVTRQKPASQTRTHLPADTSWQVMGSISFSAGSSSATSASPLAGQSGPGGTFSDTSAASAGNGASSKEAQAPGSAEGIALGYGSQNTAAFDQSFNNANGPQEELSLNYAQELFNTAHDAEATAIANDKAEPDRRHRRRRLA